MHVPRSRARSDVDVLGFISRVIVCQHPLLEGSLGEVVVTLL